MIGLFIMLWACSDDEKVKTTVITSEGKEISMDGHWHSDCIDFTSFRLQESFDFDGEHLIIVIHQSSSENCENPDVTESINITFQTLGTIEAKLNGVTVLANKVKGTQTSDSNNQLSSFKQTFFVDDSDGINVLYHGIFAGDGGAVSSDGFPMELHPFGIVQE